MSLQLEAVTGAFNFASRKVRSIAEAIRITALLYFNLPNLIVTFFVGAFLLQYVLPYEARGPFLAVGLFGVIYDVLLNLGYIRWIAIFWAVAIWTLIVTITRHFLNDRYVLPYQKLSAPFKQSNSVHNAKSAAELDALLAANDQAIAFFMGEWCPFSRDIAPAFGWLADEYSCPNYFALIQVDVTWAPDLHKRYQLTEIPTFITFVGGRPTPVQVLNVSPDARVKRVGPNKIERIFGSLELEPLMSVVKAMSDTAWEVAHEVAQKKANADSARSDYRKRNKAGQNDQTTTRVSLQPIHLNQSASLQQPQRSSQNQGTPINPMTLGTRNTGAADSPLDSSYYSSDD